MGAVPAGVKQWMLARGGTPDPEELVKIQRGCAWAFYGAWRGMWRFYEEKRREVGYRWEDAARRVYSLHPSIPVPERDPAVPAPAEEQVDGDGDTYEVEEGECEELTPGQ